MVHITCITPKPVLTCSCHVHDPDRLEDDDRLDTILETLRKKAPSLAPTPDTSDVASTTRGSDTTSVKGELARGLKDMKGKIRNLEDRLAAKRKSLAAGPAR